MLIVSVVIGYLLGSLSFSTIIGRAVAHIDIRQHGSGNAGATNTLRVLGVKYAIVVLLLDVAKGVLAVLIAWWLGHFDPWYTYLSGLAAILGHNWPVFFRFRGGKGIATTIGVVALIMPVSLLISAAVGVLVIVLTRYVSLGSLILTILIPVVFAVRHGGIGGVLFGAAIAVLSILRHRKNIVRLLRGEEHRVFSKA